MSKTTLARRIRRIGILPTTYKETKIETLKTVAGVEEIITTIKKTPVRHFKRMANDDRATLVAEMKAAAKAARKGGR